MNMINTGLQVYINKRVVPLLMEIRKHFIEHCIRTKGAIIFFFRVPSPDVVTSRMTQKYQTLALR